MLRYTRSPLPNKRFRVWMENGEHFDFGYKNPESYKVAQTFIDGASIKKRDAYRARHLGNRVERYRIQHLLPSPALFSYYLLWGASQNLRDNFDDLNELFYNK